ncbi:MAG TPA: LON peptidase substrate-binding domain-containing protein [Dongiaceae bacterium]|nr:LON peptidase substrate-binding domain-containing protein [Dongiaceae bacterium]
MASEPGSTGSASRPGGAGRGFEPGFAELPRTMPVFPLTGALLVPGGRMPLNIFEPRYLAMTRHALMQPDRLIGMVQPRERGIERKTDPGFKPEIERVGCAGRIIAFEETDDGRYQITLSGLIRFKIAQELPVDGGGFRMVAPDFAPFAADIGQPNFALPGRSRFIGTLKGYFEARNASVDWNAIDAMADRQLVVSLAMLCPFSPDEKQALLECRDLTELGEMLLALFELAVRGRNDDHRPLH